MFSLRALLLQGLLCVDIHRKKASPSFKTHLFLNGHPSDYNSMVESTSERMSITTLCVSLGFFLLSLSNAVEREVVGTPSGCHQASSAFLPLCLNGFCFFLAANINKTCQGTSSLLLPKSRHDILGACSQLFQPVHTAGVNCLSTTKNHFIN